VENFAGSGVGGDGRQYSAYHGYWPSDVTRAELKFLVRAFTEAELHEREAVLRRLLDDARGCFPGAVLQLEIKESYRNMIAKIAEEHDLLAVSDEIYDRLVYDHEHVCVPALDESIRRRTILLGGFSKDYAMTGWRIGYACGPSDIIQGMVRIHQYTIMSAPTTAQDAALTALTDGEKHVRKMLAEYDRRRRLIMNGFNRLGLTTFEPHGAFYVFPNVTASGMDDNTFAETLLREEHVAVVPGSAFGPGGEGFARCCYATAYEQIEEALQRMERFMNRHG